MIGSSIATGSPRWTIGLGLGVRAAPFDLAKVIIEYVSRRGGGVEGIAAGDQVGIGEFLELFHRFAAAAIDAPAAAGKAGPFLGGFLLCFFIILVGRLHAATGARAGGSGDVGGIGGGGTRCGRGPRLHDRFFFFDADDARTLDLRGLKRCQLRRLHDWLAIGG